MSKKLVLTEESALAVKYAITLDRLTHKELADLSDEEILSLLIEIGFSKSKEAKA